MFQSYWRIVIQPNLGKVLLIGAGSLLAAAAEVASIGLVIPVVALFSGGESPSSQKFVPALQAVVRAVGLVPSPSSMLFLALAGVTIFIVLKSAMAIGLNYLTARVSQETKRTLSLRMFAAYSHARYAELVRRQRGQIIKDIEGPPDSMGYVVYYSGLSVAALGQLILTLGFLFWLSPSLTFLMGGIGLATVLLLRVSLQERMAKLGQSEYALEQAGAGLLVNAIDGARVVRVHHLADRLKGRLQEIFDGRMKIAVRRLSLQQAPKIGFELVGMLTVVLLIALSQMYPSLGLDFPALAAFVLALRQITPAFSTLNTNFLNMAQYWKQIQVIEDTLTKLPLEDSDGGSVALQDVIRTIRLESVTFAYPDNPGRAVINNLSLTFARGKVSALVGATGAGKTTITDLILRLQEPRDGRILADGGDIARCSLAEWRRRIGYVGQDVFLFNGTLAENIAALDDGVPMDEIVRAAKLAQIHGDIAGMSGGYDSLVGDRGVKLSGGQRQRIAVARAILRRPQILIMDEATSALDNLTERALHEAIDFIRREAIVILIAHRLTTVELADDIIVLQDGRVAEQGMHQELLAKRGLYWRLYQAAQEPSSAIEDAAVALREPAP